MDLEADANYSAATDATQTTNTTSAETQDPTKENEMNDIDDKFSALLKLFADVRDDKQQRALYNAALDLQETWRATMRKVLLQHAAAADTESARIDDLADALRVDILSRFTGDTDDASHDDQATA